MRNKKKKIGLIAGVFDLVHAGHVLALQSARAQCDRLIVAMHVAPSDPSKKPPIMLAFERTTILSAFRCVDQVVCYVTEDELLGFLTDLRPDIRFLGEEYKSRPITGGDLSIEIRFLSRDLGFSTTELRARVYAAEVMRIGGVREPAHAVR